MTREDILALRPASDATASEWQDAVAKARAALGAEINRQNAALARSKADVLTTDDADLLAARQEYDQASLSVQRLQALLPEMKDAFAKAFGGEQLARLREQHTAADASLDALRQWQAKSLPKIKALIAEGFAAHDAAHWAIEGFKGEVIEAYAHPEVREAGALGVEMPALSGDLPRVLFANWSTANG